MILSGSLLGAPVKSRVPAAAPVTPSRGTSAFPRVWSRGGARRRSASRTAGNHCGIKHTSVRTAQTRSGSGSTRVSQRNVVVGTPWAFPRVALARLPARGAPGREKADFGHARGAVTGCCPNRPTRALDGSGAQAAVAARPHDDGGPRQPRRGGHRDTAGDGRWERARPIPGPGAVAGVLPEGGPRTCPASRARMIRIRDLDRTRARQGPSVDR